MARRPATATLRRMVRRVLLPILIALACASPASAAERLAPPFSNADYWTFADDLMLDLDSWWDPARQAYILRGVPSVRVNSALLLAHAVAAHDGHTGATRQDARARVLVDRLTTAPAWLGSTWAAHDVLVAGPRPRQAPARFTRAQGGRGARLGLARTGRARALGRRRGADPAPLATCARSTAWQRVRVANQINWNAEMYASATAVSHRSDLLRHEYRRQLAAFAADRANFGRGFQFHYEPRGSGDAAINLDTPSTPASSCMPSATTTRRCAWACGRFRARRCGACGRGSGD